MGDFTFPDTNWEYHTEDSKRSRRFLSLLKMTSWCKGSTRRVSSWICCLGGTCGQSDVWWLSGLGHGDFEGAEFQNLVTEEKLSAKF